jgi:hypothetical protein
LLLVICREGVQQFFSHIHIGRVKVFPDAITDGPFLVFAQPVTNIVQKMGRQCCQLTLWKVSTRPHDRRW